jgi:ABC-type ATPase involved in cell division
MPWTAQFEVNTTGGTKHFAVEDGTVQFIAGPNGVGKSALLHQLFRTNNQDRTIELLPGHRQITFPNDDIDQIGFTIEQLHTNMKVGGDAFSRFRGAWGDAHLKSFIKRALQRDADTNYKIAELVRNKQNTDAFISGNPSIVRSINSVFTAARLNIQIETEDGRFKAVRGGNSFKVDVLSDGERAALLLVCAILSQKKDGILLIDEPEKHLNAAISGPLIASAIQTRPDLAFILSSHDLELIKWVKPKQIVHVRNSHLEASPYPGSPEQRTYDIDLLDPADGVSEEIKQAVLGSKERILFVEGTSTSDDRLLYSVIYKDRSVVARGGWETVVNNVRVLRQNGAYAWLSVSGMIDNDGRNSDEKEAFQAEDIYCVDAPTIENLFMHHSIIEIMAIEVHKFFGGATPEQRLEEIKKIYLLCC